MGFAQQKELESQYLMSTFGRKPVELVSGSGMEAFDDEGNAYLDFIGGIGVLSLGHCHPQVVAAIEERLGQPLFIHPDAQLCGALGAALFALEMP